ncbi:hypothetical protein Tco_0666814 [Tanacetum coccineum]
MIIAINISKDWYLNAGNSCVVCCTGVPGNSICPHSQNTGIDISEPGFTQRQAIPSVVTHRFCQNVVISSLETCSTQTEVSRIIGASSSIASVPETSICPNSQKANVDTPKLGSTQTQGMYRSRILHRLDLLMAKEQTHVGIFVIEHDDSGKSTTAEKMASEVIMADKATIEHMMFLSFEAKAKKT